MDHLCDGAEAERLLEEWISEAAPDTEIEARLGHATPEGGFCPLWPADTRLPSSAAAGPTETTRHIDFTLRDGVRVSWDVDARKVVAAVRKETKRCLFVRVHENVVAKLVLSSEEEVDEAANDARSELVARAVHVRKKTRRSWAVAPGWRMDATAVRQGPHMKNLAGGVNFEIERTEGGQARDLLPCLRDVAARILSPTPPSAGKKRPPPG